MEDGVFSVLFIPGFLVGFAIAVVILIRWPKLYRKLRCKICIGSQESILEKEECFHTVPDSGEATRSNDYSEIDDKKTVTFTSSKQKTARKNEDDNNETMQRYEKCGVGKQTHRYSDLADGTSGVSAKHNASSNNSYEPFTPGNIAKSQDKADENHDYFILEPGSEKRLPVKPIENKSDSLQRDPGHVYFILEPGTNRVKPLSQYIADNGASSSNARDSGHIYFVLEPMTETNESETLPYAVNDVAANPSYYILEKAERYA